MDLSRARAIFFDESRELCDILETALLDRKQYPATLTTFDLLFRTAHTIKGSAGVFGLDALVRFTHVMENVLERLRFGQVPLNEEVVRNHREISRIARLRCPGCYDPTIRYFTLLATESALSSGNVSPGF